jgi:hypothetical protein
MATTIETVCDECGRIAGISKYDVTVYSCGHAFCAKHPIEKTERGEPICAKCRKTVYVKEVL